jgi:hypothetical protein
MKQKFATAAQVRDPSTKGTFVRLLTLLLLLVEKGAGSTVPALTPVRTHYDRQVVGMKNLKDYVLR